MRRVNSFVQLLLYSGSGDLKRLQSLFSDTIFKWNLRRTPFGSSLISFLDLLFKRFSPSNSHAGYDDDSLHHSAVRNYCVLRHDDDAIADVVRTIFGVCV